MSREKTTYVSEIVIALKALNGAAHIKEICDYIENRDVLPNIHTNPNWRNNVSTEITTHCREMDSYRGREDLFYSVYGKNEGYWGLLSMNVDGVEESPVIKRQIDTIKNDDTISETEKDMLIKARVGQGVFRKNLIEKYGCCIITGINDIRLLSASHIKPWRSANNKERLSVNNGLLLSPTYDKLFDIGFISFDEDMKIIVSSKLSEANKKIINIDTTKSYLEDPDEELLEYIRYHRNNVFKS